jgi:putative membrane protein
MIVMKGVCEMHDNQGNIWKGLVAGVAGGLVASWTMNQFQAAWTRITANSEKSHGAQSAQPSDGSSGDQSEDAKEQDDATVETAKVISREVFGHELQESEKESAGTAVHYAFGTVSGGLYGALAEVTPQVTTGAGLPFGAAFWLLADEIAVPLFGLSKGPTEYPVSTHVYSFASHLVYGVTAEMSRRAVRQVL